MTEDTDAGRSPLSIPAGKLQRAESGIAKDDTPDMLKLCRASLYCLSQDEVKNMYTVLSV